jgi:hypothetical protein
MTCRRQEGGEKGQLDGSVDGGRVQVREWLGEGERGFSE